VPAPRDHLISASFPQNTGCSALPLAPTRVTEDYRGVPALTEPKSETKFLRGCATISASACPPIRERRHTSRMSFAAFRCDQRPNRLSGI
jgi:hypothetical protein